jgi:hypothetical protein
MKVGDYVKVIKKPEHWEGGGEELKDLYAYVGHIGVVLETDFHKAWYPSRGMVLVRFPDTKDKTDYEGPWGFGQRNIEFEALEVVSSPQFPLPRICVES